MDERRHAYAVNSLKESRAKGLTFYEASQVLLQRGLTQNEVTLASYDVAYDAPVTPPTPKPEPPKLSPRADAAYQNVVAQQFHNDAVRDARSAAWRASFVPRWVPGTQFRAAREWNEYRALKYGKSPSTVWMIGAYVSASVFAGLYIVPGLILSALPFRTPIGFLLACYVLMIVGLVWFGRYLLRRKEPPPKP